MAASSTGWAPARPGERRHGPAESMSAPPNRPDPGRSRSSISHAWSRACQGSGVPRSVSGRSRPATPSRAAAGPRRRGRRRQRVDQRRGHDHAVGAGLRDRADVGGLAHPEPDGDRDRRGGRDLPHEAPDRSTAAPSGRRSRRRATRSTGSRRSGPRSRRAAPAASSARRGRRPPARLRERRPRTARPRRASGRRR